VNALKLRNASQRSIQVLAFTMCGEKVNMLWTIVVILLVMWLLGFSFHIAGGLIHLLLVVAVVVLIVNLVRRTA
jgi:L-asparagine transporter-like permease